MEHLKILYETVDHPLLMHSTIEKNIPNLKEPFKSYLTNEWLCAGLMLSNGDLAPIIEIGTRKITDISLLSEETVNYIKMREKEENHPYLSSRYSHILYKLTRNNLYARRAIEAYRRLADEYLVQLATQKKNIYDFIEVVESYLKLSLLVRYELDECKQQIVEWYKYPAQHLYYYLCFIELISTSTLFKRKDINGYTKEALFTWQDKHVRTHDEKYLKACLPLAKKEGVKTNQIYLLLAETQLKFADEERHRDDTGLIESECLFEASNYLKLAGETERANNLLRKLKNHNKQVKFHSINSKLSQESINTLIECYEDIVKSYLNPSYESVFIPIAFDNRLLVEKNNDSMENSFLDFISTSHYDLNMNVKKLSEYEIKRQRSFFSLQFTIEITLTFLFKELIKQMKDNNRDLFMEGVAYFERTWFNQDFKSELWDDSLKYNWFVNIRPAIEILLKVSLLDDKHLLNPEEQMAFDQLAIKFEGLLRDICQVAGLTTTKVDDKQTLQMDINEILNSTELEPIFHKEDITLWQFTFTRSGYNIRNNVAHAFLRPHHYTSRKSNLILLCYIKLAKYGELLNPLESQKE